MKNFHVIVPALAIIMWGCTPAQFGYNVGGTTSALQDGGSTTSNPTLSPNGGSTGTEEQVGDGGDGGDGGNDGMPTPTATPTGGSGGGGGNEDGGNHPGDGCKDHDHKKPDYVPRDNPNIPGNYSCGKSNGKKVLICHVPGGDYAKSHTLCIAVQGAVNGHGVAVGNLQAKTKANGMHLKDYLGPCGQNPPNQEN
jgi:hypothetical protein